MYLIRRIIQSSAGVCTTVLTAIVIIGFFERARERTHTIRCIIINTQMRSFRARDVASAFGGWSLRRTT